MPDWSLNQYEQAKKLVDEPGIAPEKRARRAQMVADYEARLDKISGGAARAAVPQEGLDGLPQPEPSSGGTPLPPGVRFAPDPEAEFRTPKAERNAALPDEWRPQRELGAMDFVPSHMIPGGRLEIFYDMPIEAFKRKAAEERQRLIEAGAQAEAEVQMRGPLLGLDGVAQLSPIIQAGRAAAAVDPDALTEDSPEYRQFVDGAWAQAIASRPPDAGPMRRHRDVSIGGQLSGVHAGRRLGLGERFAHLMEEGTALTHAAERGAARALSFGASDPLIDSIMELGGKGQAELSRNLEEAHPVASGVGAGLSLLSPQGLPSMISRGIYGALLPKGAGALGRAAAGGGAGAGLSVLEGAGRDVVAGDPESAITEAPGRAAFGFGAGAGGDLLASGGKALASSIAQGAMRGPQARSVYQEAEAGGWKFDPILGIREPLSMKAARTRAEASGVPVAQDIAQRARGPINDAVQTADEALKADLGAETGQYLRSTTKQVPVKNTWTTLRQAIISADDKQVPAVQKELIKFSEVGVVSQAPAKWPAGKYYMDARQAKRLGLDDGDLSAETQAVIGSLDELPDNAVLELTPRAMDAKQFYARSNTLADNAQQADKMADSQMASLWRQVQRGALLDREKFPVTKPVRGLEAEVPDGPGTTKKVQGFAAQQALHSGRIDAMQAERELTGARSGKRTAQTTPDDLAELNRNLVSQGKQGFSVEKEAALSRWAPPEIQRELALLRAANMVESIGGKSIDENPTRAGLLRAVGDFVKPRAYGLGKALSAESAPVVSPTFPISDKLYSFLQARMPRASAFLPGMDPARLIAEEAERSRRPKKYSDLTPDQQKLLSEAIQ